MYVRAEWIATMDSPWHHTSTSCTSTMDCYNGSSLALHKHIMYEHNGLLQQIQDSNGNFERISSLCWSHYNKSITMMPSPGELLVAASVISVLLRPGDGGQTFHRTELSVNHSTESEPQLRGFSPFHAEPKHRASTGL
jgi:hypothetical protein